MSKVVKVILIGMGVLVLAGGLVFAGAMIGRRTGFGLGWMHPGYNMMNGGTRTGRRGSDAGPGRMGSGIAAGPGLMQGFGRNTAKLTPLTVDQAYQAAGKYVTALNNADLKIAEVMVFDNNAYLRVVEKGTGIGAFELLVDPDSQVVYPEHGPNMMWNFKYGGLNHQKMMGGGRGNVPGQGMMGSYTSNAAPADVSAKMTVTSAQALQAAQQYLDSAMPGTKTAVDADPFYGYYTIDILRDGKTVGMLSVNGFSAQVFLHTWHGTFIEAKDY